MSLEIKFRNLVDTTSSTLAEYDIKELDLYRQYEHYGIAYDYALTSEIVELHLQRVVQESLCAGSNFHVSHLRKLRDQFILHYIIDEKSLQPYFYILEKILQFITNGSIYSLDTENQWRKAIQAVKDIITLSATPSVEHLERIYKRQFAVGYAAKKLRKKGYKLTTEDGKIIMDSSDQESLIKQLEADIKFLGGINITTRLFASIENENLFDHEHEELIRKFGYLPLKTGSKINLDGRDVAKVAITLLDFGGFNDRTIVFLLDLMIRNQIYISDPQYQNQAKEIQNKINKLSGKLAKLNNLSSNNANNSPFFNSWFLSVPQSLVLLDNVNSNDSLKTELWKIRSVSASTLDFYFEYSLFGRGDRQ